ncbi:hypothetical protein DEO72_LG3g1974 [Vigna unguiculata]|uniref:Uncharacterized protein n=1 Tax=Vigna unguiculata TaxID=3917 RepID=A0A4D6LG10_VIGUN|nr:hypothetical protein DEO72_LG3g1974 [Vigna unguiculata]
MPLMLGLIGFGWGKAGAKRGFREPGLKSVICLSCKLNRGQIVDLGLKSRTPFFLARAVSSISLCKFWPLFSLQIPAIPLSANSGHSNNASSVLPLPPSPVLPLPPLRCRRRCLLLSPRLPARPPRETTRDHNVRPPRETTMRDHHARPLPPLSLSLSLCKCSGVPPPPRETLFFFHQLPPNFRASGHSASATVAAPPFPLVRVELHHPTVIYFLRAPRSCV